MTPEQFAELLAELKTIKLILAVASVLVAVSASMAAVRTYRYVKHHVTEGLDDLFRREALDLLLMPAFLKVVRPAEIPMSIDVIRPFEQPLTATGDQALQLPAFGPPGV